MLAACSDRGEKDTADATPEAVVRTVERRAEPLTTQQPGRLEAFRSADVRARASGVVIERRYQEGQKVAKGDVLFRIDPQPLSAALDAARGALAKAQAEHDSARDKIERYRGLLEERAISAREDAESRAAEARARAEVLAARAEVRKAELNLGYTSVVSPIAGRVRRAEVTEGALVGLDSATLLTRVEQIDPIYVNFSQPAAEVYAMTRDLRAGKLQHGSESAAPQVHVTLPDGRAYTLPGKLLFTDLAVDPGTDTIAMRALLPNPDGVLLPGAFVKVSMQGAVNPNVVRVPRESLTRTADGAVVRVVDAQGKVHDTKVHAEAIDGHDWLVTDGLKGGEKVIVQNVAQFADGMQVKLKEAATDAAAKAQPPRDAKPQDNAKPVEPARAGPASNAETQ
ncbi:efflux RND transporter periplasmic adaptor subunit [Pandoraea apista]|uniref:Efflux RND transporter periplasmic adaptor subunit n=1 Tax=Pandoraea apista TaxID=93218 RepID=A0ABX9ZS01_9BURK|nr:efflux transporter periplasmic adaptor subunit [Pandoraea apista]PTE01940.1 efflux RND transporter periplasmic adaptor subunit [Pandoraea apista]RRJ34199.1 efflux RND transporter periplasmic adaptor subunit [Pandoraea apista]RRJ80510.1 efflux RND transporter periplasmic adaptor subunit [Pandoraea apista]RRW89213.1 efflux RND transporter periplasmic adaptor subunit [Pandoraea apista]